jgi:hypothetical protein
VLATVGVDAADVADRPAGGLGHATPHQLALIVGGVARQLAREPGGALGLARARVTGLAGRELADAVSITRVAVAAVGRALAVRNAHVRGALKPARTVARVGAAIADRAATLTGSDEDEAEE